MRAVSAARAAPVNKRKGPERFHQALAREATNQLLNVWGVIRDLYDGFRRSDAYAKYRILIVMAWAVLSVTGMGVSCAGGSGDSNALGARLVVSFVNGEAVYMVLNESSDVWEDVRLVVNDRYSAAVTRVAPGAEVTLGAKKLIDESGKPAPPDLQVSKLLLKTSDDQTVLVRDGKAPGR
jgi:hypothetical protein